MTNYSGQQEFYHYDPERPGVVPWARMSRDARATWGLLCLQYRMPLDPSGARHDIRARVVMHVVESQAPVPLRSDVDPTDPKGGNLTRKSMALLNVMTEQAALTRVRMVWGERVREIEALVDDDKAGARAAAMRLERDKTAAKRREDAERQRDDGKPDRGAEGVRPGASDSGPGGAPGAGDEGGGSDGDRRGRQSGGLLGSLRGFLGRR